MNLANKMLQPCVPLLLLGILSLNLIFNWPTFSFPVLNTFFYVYLKTPKTALVRRNRIDSRKVKRCALRVLKHFLTIANLLTMVIINLFVVHFLLAWNRLFSCFTFLSILAKFNQTFYGPQKILMEKLKHDWD